MNDSFPVLEHLAKHYKTRRDIDTIAIIAIVPVYQDTFQLFQAFLNCGFSIRLVLGLDYSSDEKIVSKLNEQGIPTKVFTSSHIYAEVYNNLLDIQKEQPEKRFLLIENGGYFSHVIHHKLPSFSQLCLGAIEETKKGLWSSQRIHQLLYPIIQIADCEIKKIESAHIGEPLVTVLNLELKRIGESLQGKSIGIMGYGWIGKSVARYLRNFNVRVRCFDINPVRQIEAYYDGFVDGHRDEVIQSSDIIIGATGNCSLHLKDFYTLKTNSLLISASSRQVEFELDELKKHTLRQEPLSQHIEVITINNGPTIRLLNKGKPANFLIGSMADQIMDLLLSLMFQVTLELAVTYADYPNAIFGPKPEWESEIAALSVNNL